MVSSVVKEDVRKLVDGLNFAEKVERSLRLIGEAYEQFGDSLVVANSLGKDSSVAWHLAKRVSADIRGFIVTTRFKPAETVAFMKSEVARYGELQVFRNDAEIPERLYETDPNRCCDILKVEPTRQAIREMDVACWVTGLRCTEGRGSASFVTAPVGDPLPSIPTSPGTSGGRRTDLGSPPSAPDGRER